MQAAVGRTGLKHELINLQHALNAPHRHAWACAESNIDNHPHPTKRHSRCSQNLLAVYAQAVAVPLNSPST